MRINCIWVNGKGELVAEAIRSLKKGFGDLMGARDNIRRVITGGTRGWQFHCGRGGKLVTKLFSDGVHGGNRKALRAAKEYRDEYVSTHPNRRAKFHSNSSRNLGIPGVTYVRDGNYRRIRGTVQVDGEQVTKSWSVDEFGYADALVQAKQWRKKHEERLRKGGE